MTAGGQDIAIGLFGDGDGSFDPGDNLLFYGQSVKGNRYTRTNVYQLSYGGTPGPRMAFRDGHFTGTGSTPTSFQTTLHLEKDLRYTATYRPGVNEAWYWKVQSEGDPNSDPSDYTVTVPHPDPNSYTIDVRARVLGLSNGDHPMALSLNSMPIGTDSFSGQVLHVQNASTTSSTLAAGSNTFTIDITYNGTPAPNLIAGDWFEIDYRRTYDVDNDYVEFEGQVFGNQHFQIPGFSTPYIWLMDITDPLAPVLLMSEPAVQAGMTWTLPFEDIIASTHRYAASSIFVLKKPATTVLDVPSNLKSPANGADYIIITDRSLMASMEPLRLLRQGQGMRAVTVATDDIYDEFNFGRLDPHAIKSFLSYAYANWAAPAPTYVLLAGDGHIDYRDDFGSGTPEIVPPLLSIFPGFGEAPSDNDYVAVAGGDVYPEMYIGRLPIRSPADASTVVTNIINYDTNPPAATLNQQALFVADNNDVIFQAILNNLQAFIPATLTPVDAYLPGGDPNNPPSQTQINRRRTWSSMRSTTARCSASTWGMATSICGPKRRSFSTTRTHPRPSARLDANRADGQWIPVVPDLDELHQRLLRRLDRGRTGTRRLHAGRGVDASTEPGRRSGMGAISTRTAP